MIPKFTKILKSKVFEIVFYIFCSFVFINSLGYLIQDILPETSLNFYLMLTQQFVFVGMILFFKNQEFISKKTLLIKKNPLKNYFKAIFEGLGCLMLFGILLTIVSDFITPYGFLKQQNIFDLFPSDQISLSIMIFITCIIAPITEELIFRGAILGSLLPKVSKYRAIFISSILFSILHFQPEVAGSIFIISLIISTLYLKYESIYIPIVFHIVNNSLTTIITL